LRVTVSSTGARESLADPLQALVAVGPVCAGVAVVTVGSPATIEAMATVREIALGDLVELIEAVDAAPAGARGGITDVLGEGKAIVELTSGPLEPVLERIVVAPVAKLRLLG
jgi:hypothetical protein